MANINVKGTKSKEEKNKGNKKIAPIFLSNGLSTTLIIPIDLARKYNIDRPSHVTIEDTQNGILIKKLEVKN
jgi:hypothetical protein